METLKEILQKHISELPKNADEVQLKSIGTEKIKYLTQQCTKNNNYCYEK